jgi:hypothetical protein
MDSITDQPGRGQEGDWVIDSVSKPGKPSSQLKPEGTAAALRPGLKPWREALNAVLPPKRNP